MHSKGIRVSISPAMDIFSLGIVFHEFWTGKRPEFDSKYHLTCEAVCDGSPIKLSSSLPDNISSLIGMMLVKKPEDRISARKALEILAKTDDVFEMRTFQNKYFEGNASSSAKTGGTSKTETSRKVDRGFYRADEFD